MIRLISILMLAFLVSCTQNISIVHSKGHASDVIDTEQAPVNDIKPQTSLEIPFPV